MGPSKQFKYCNCLQFFAQKHLLPHSTSCILSLDMILILGIVHVSKNHYFLLKYAASPSFPVLLTSIINLHFLKLAT